MNSLEDEQPFLKQLLTLISAQFGDRCEVVLHDLTRDYNHTIVDIRNGGVTNRKIGGCGSNLGLEVLNGSVEGGDRFNYVTTTPDGKILRSSSIYVKNDDGKIIASICINLDITESIQFEGFLRKYNHFEAGQGEFFAQDVNTLLDYMVQQAQQLMGKDPKTMNKDERISFLSYLDQKGAFQISKSSVKICKVLGISKFTLYSDLDTIRGAGNAGQIPVFDEALDEQA
ncbi:YheO domain protein [Treponema primitia ZAS-2]|uniref:YheO domain protein n=1 Tax=Treponema primitia (strain ATCC BAA-887 / DSM 12427 / ZAS-2) TaxID=545694 RepID=F5YGZ9_TREPZ|nr:helix-turn-helix transcriptional regulator [Treponema primitia]AEF85431.1 YheO domain protein [Treponema primitia ZAS-2]